MRGVKGLCRSIRVLANGADDMRPVFWRTTGPCSRICFKTQKINLSQVFAGQKVGLAGRRAHWFVSFMEYDFGYFDDETCGLEPIENPFAPKVLPMSLE